MLGECIVKRLKLSKMHKDSEEMEASLSVCSAARDGSLRQMGTDQVMLHRKALVSGLAVFIQFI